MAGLPDCVRTKLDAFNTAGKSSTSVPDQSKMMLRITVPFNHKERGEHKEKSARFSQCSLRLLFEFPGSPVVRLPVVCFAFRIPAFRFYFCFLLSSFLFWFCC